MSNALEQASLIMVPSGYENGTLGSLKPLDGSGDFTFSRGSDISATRVNEDGYIEKGYENLLLQSNQFDTTWTTSNASVTSGQAGYDGSNDAWQLTSINSVAGQRVQQTFTAVSGVYNFSCYAKAGNYNQDLYFRIVGSTSYRAYFDLSDGSIQGGSNLIDYKSTDVGNGWYRFEASFNVSNAYTFEIRFRDTNDAGSYFYIQDAMLNQGLVAYPYVETTTAPVAGGILEDMPRLDYTDSSCPALLLEPQRTNIVPYSEYLSSGWQIVNINNIELSDTLSPDGVTHMSKVTFSDAGLNSYIRQNRSMSASGSITVSLFVKKGTIDSYISLFISGIDNTGKVYFNLDNGTIASETGTLSNKSIVDYGNGIYRISITAESTNDLSFQFRAQSADVDGGNPTENATQFYWGAQLEEGSYPTSYIPTYGTSQTRLRDTATADITNITDSTEGTIFTEFAKIQDFSTFQLDDGTQNNRITLYPRNNTSSITFILTIGGVQVIRQDPAPSGLDTTEFNKYAIAWGLNDFRVYVNGVKIYTSTSNITFASGALTDLDFYQYNNKEFLLFPTALSDDECIALTTIS